MNKIIISGFVLAISSSAFAGSDYNIFRDAENDYIPASTGGAIQHDATLHTFLDAETGYISVRSDDSMTAPTSAGSEAGGFYGTACLSMLKNRPVITS